MATFSIMIEFIVDEQDQEAADTVSKQIIEAAKLEDLIVRASVQDIEMLDDDEAPEIDFNEDDE